MSNAFGKRVDTNRKEILFWKIQNVHAVGKTVNVTVTVLHAKNIILILLSLSLVNGSEKKNRIPRKFRSTKTVKVFTEEYILTCSRRRVMIAE